MTPTQRITLRPAASGEKRRIYDMALSTDYMRDCFARDFAQGFSSFDLEYGSHYFDGREPELFGGLMICLDGTPIGFISYGQVSDFYGRPWAKHLGTMELDLWLDGEAHCGKGYGTQAIHTLCDHLHKTYHINQFMICPERINPRAIRAYQKAGFCEVPSAEKPDVLLEIFGRQGLDLLQPDDLYYDEDSCFMIKRCEESAKTAP